jgi:hypothetical protein
MKTMHIGEFKAQFSDVVEMVKNGEEIKVVKGRNNETAGYFSMKRSKGLSAKRKLGIGLKSEEKNVYFIGGHNTTEAEFFGE